VKRSVLIVPLRMPLSDLVWVRSVERGAAQDAGNPLDTPQGRITPELEPALTQKDTAQFYFLAFGEELAEAQITVSKDGKALGTFPLAKPERGEAGVARYVGTIPLAQWEPGQYELTVRVGQDSTQAMFEVIPF
jgi:hypothetical protein